jgi:putative hydrolases of HD superfamily
LSESLKREVNDLKEFTLPYYKLKELQRTGWLEKLNIENSESVASHTLLMIVVLLFLASKYSFSSTKKLKLIQMILIHDLAESIIGDLTPEAISSAKKKQMEDEAFRFITNNFPPNNLRKDLLNFWKEYNEHTSFDSKLVHIIDKMEMLLQADFYFSNRQNIHFSQIAPFKRSVSTFVDEDKGYIDSETHCDLQSNENKKLTEIKEILAYLCK